MGRPQRTRTVTIRDVARAAGVSPATVSRVMNGRVKVAAELAQRVQRVAGSLGYRPSALAQGLATGRTGLVAILVPDLGNPMFQSVLRGISRAANAQGYRVVVGDSHETPGEEPVLARETRLRTDGLVLCSPRVADDELCELVDGLRPLVLVNRQVAGLDVPTVWVDYAAGARAVVAHLVGLGHRHVAYLAGPAGSVSHRQRLDTLRACAGERLRLSVLECGSMHDDGYEAAERALATGATALIGYNDLVALGALAWLQSAGVAVPGRMSVVGFDDIPFARYTNPALTTVAVPQEELGLQAWARLSAPLHGLPSPGDVCFTPQLEVRASTGAACG